MLILKLIVAYLKKIAQSLVELMGILNLIVVDLFSTYLQLKTSRFFQRNTHTLGHNPDDGMCFFKKCLLILGLNSPNCTFRETQWQIEYSIPLPYALGRIKQSA